MQFVARLRNESKDCNFGLDTDNQIRDAVLCKCTSNYVRRKLLEEGQAPTSARTLEVAEQCGEVEHQMTELGAKSQGQQSVNSVFSKPSKPKSKYSKVSKLKVSLKGTLVIDVVLVVILVGKFRSVLQKVRPAGSATEKIISLVCAKPNKTEQRFTKFRKTKPVHANLIMPFG